MTNKGTTVTIYGQDFTPFSKGVINVEYKKTEKYNLQGFSNLVYRFQLIVKSINECKDFEKYSLDNKLVKELKEASIKTDYNSSLINNIALIVEEGCDLIPDLDESTELSQDYLLDLKEKLISKINEYKNAIHDLFERFNRYVFKPLSESLVDPNQDQLLRVGHSEGTQPSAYSIANNECFGNIVGTISIKYNDDKDGVKEFIKLLCGVSKSSNKLFPVTFKLEIFSRFDEFDQLIYPDRRPSPYFLASLLLRSRGFDSAGMHFSSTFDWDSLFDMFLVTLISRTLKKAIAKGVFKKYQRYEINSNRVRGSIDIARHIKLNADLDNGKIACSYRENTTDNMAIHLIISALDKLKNKYPDLYRRNIDQNTQQIINSLKFEIGYPKYNTKTLIAKNSIRISHPYYLEYRILQDYSLKVLRGEGVSPFGNDNESIEGILFYVPDLWEEYLEYYMQKYIRHLRNDNNENGASNPEYKLYSQKKISKMTGFTSHPENVVFDPSESKPRNESRPDFVFSFKNVSNFTFYDDYVPFFMIDAKYRPKWEEALKGFLDNDEIGKDYDKCLRDMVSIDANAAAVIFPISEDDYSKLISNHQIMIAHRFSKFNRNGVFYTFPIIVPKLNSDYKSYYKWDRDLNEHVNSSLISIGSSLEYEYQKALIYLQKMKDINQEVDKISQKISAEYFEPLINFECNTEHQDIQPEVN